VALEGGTLPVASGGGSGDGAGAGGGQTAEPKVRRVDHDDADDGEEAACREPATKPKPLDIASPEYPEAARSAEVEGKVRLKLRIGARGEVLKVEVVAGLGHGLDQAAIAAAKASTFAPATRCGQPVAATVTIAIEFLL
jgi:protein TonB